MSKFSWATLSGLAVMLAGLVAIVATIAASSATGKATSMVTLDSTPQVVVVEAAPPKMEGVGSAIQKVLENQGKLRTYDPNAIDVLAPEVARVLSYYGVTLAIPETGGTDS